MNKKIIMCLVFLKNFAYQYNYNQLILNNYTDKTLYVYRVNPMDIFTDNFQGFTTETVDLKSNKSIKMSYKDLGFFFSLGDNCNQNLSTEATIASFDNSKPQEACFGFFLNWKDKSNFLYSKYRDAGNFAHSYLNLILYLSASYSKDGYPIFSLQVQQWLNTDQGLLPNLPQELSSDYSYNPVNLNYDLRCHFDRNHINGNCCQNKFCNSSGTDGTINPGCSIYSCN